MTDEEVRKMARSIVRPESGKKPETGREALDLARSLFELRAEYEECAKEKPSVMDYENSRLFGEQPDTKPSLKAKFAFHYSYWLNQLEGVGAPLGHFPMIHGENPHFRQWLKEKLSGEANEWREGCGVFDDATIERLEDEFFFSRGLPREAVIRFLETMPLVVLSLVPSSILSLIDQARWAYGMELCDAVASLCRTIIESAITDVGVRLHLFPSPKGVDDYFRDYPPFARSDKVLGETGPRRKEFRQLYNETSAVIHGESTKGLSEAFDLLRRTTELTEHIYVANHRQLASGESPVE